MERRVYASHRVLCCLPLILLALAVTDLRAQSFVPAGNMTTRRLDHSSTLLQDGRVLIAGGMLAGPSPGGSGSALSSAEIYDPVYGAFTETGPMKAARAGH